jgi:putative MATE family efflux protein
MKDMTKGPVGGHVLQLAAFIAMTTAFQTLYFLADLYFVGRLGKEAIAGVGLAGNLMFLVLALTQSLGVGATSLIAQALGRKDRPGGLAFNQALCLSMLLRSRLLACASTSRAARTPGGWPPTRPPDPRRAYLDRFIPAPSSSQFPLVGMGAALRGMGDMKFPTLIQVGTVVLNIVLAPTLMFGWVTGRPLGVAGTGLASFIAVAFGCVAFTLYFCRKASPIRPRPEDWGPRLGLWGQILRIGLPAGGEFALVSVYMVLVYDIIRPFGSAAQAGFGIGIRLVQSLFLPVVAIAFAVAPVAGQNYGAGLGERVRETFYSAARMTVAIVIVLTLTCHLGAIPLVRFFNPDPEVVAIGAEYLRIVSWNFLASGLAFVSSSVFQGMGNTLPPLASSSMRLVLFALPAYVVSHRPGFHLREVWYLSVMSVTIQVIVNLWLLHREFGRRLPREAGPGAPAVAEA